MTITIDIKESATDKILHFLEHYKDDVTIISQDEDDMEDLKLLEEAKRDREGIKSIDELLKEYSIES